MWRSWVVSAKADDVVVLPVLGVPVTRMFDLLFLTLPFCAMELALYYFGYLGLLQAVLPDLILLLSH